MSDQPLSRRARRAQNRELSDWLADMPEGLSDEEKAAYEAEMAAAARRDRTRTANRSRRAADSPVDAIRTPQRDEEESQEEEPQTEVVEQVQYFNEDPAPQTEGQQVLPVADFEDEDLADTDPAQTDPADTESADAEFADTEPAESEQIEPVEGQLELDISVEQALAQRDRQTHTPVPGAVPGLATSTNLFASAIDPELLANQSRLAEIAQTITSRVQIAGGAPGPTEDLDSAPVPVVEAEDLEEPAEPAEPADQEEYYTAADEAEELEIDLSPLEQLQTSSSGLVGPEEQQTGREFDTSTLSHSAIIPAVSEELEGQADTPLDQISGDPIVEVQEEQSFDAVIGGPESDERVVESSYAAEHPVEAQRAHGLEPQEQTTGFDFGLVSTSSLIVAGIGILALIIAIVLFIIN
ncbi:hypothetical protein [Micrococcoides hystricis]|uniref:Uncharacterized protein n=1 Tax=Micrococcoides hystricis TaxID=1572761 RepID=A0ABV6P7S3_9MICC